MTRLLVSVRDVDEAREAWRAGVHLIDMKDPAAGPLAACSTAVWRAVVEALPCDGPDAVPLSVALGELLAADAIERAAATAEFPFRFAKVGLSGCAARSDWLSQWRAWREQLPPSIVPVAVAYADSAAAVSPEPAEVLERGHELGCRAFLIDTFRKDGRSLFAYRTNSAVGELIQAARKRGMLAVLAGSLRIDDLQRVLDLAPDFIAIRGAACVGPRHGRLDPQRIAEWLDRLPRPALSVNAPP